MGQSVAAAARLRIAQVVSGMENEAAGTTYCVRRLCQTLAAKGASVKILAIGDDRVPRCERSEMSLYPRDGKSVPGFGALLFSRGLAKAISSEAEGGAILHNHGLWRMPNVYVGRAAAKGRVPLVVSPHGMLGVGALKFSWRKKQLFSMLAQKPALAAASCFHATSGQELEDVRAFGLSAPVAIIPNGVDIPPADSLRRDDTAVGARTVLYLGRVHPKKGIDRLLHAWSKVADRRPGWRLRVIGPSEGGHDRELQALSASLGLRSVEFHPGLFGEEKDAAFRQADLFVLPTLDENFGMVVAEALANATPVISTRGAPWGGLETHGCGWWIDHGVEPLARCLDVAMAMPREALGSMGAKGREWMARDFSWDHAADDMLDVYRWCAGFADRPQTVVE